MICPHCSQNLLRRERGNRTCSKCRRVFALEPKESPLGLHDIRVRTLAERLGDGGRLRYTLPQLWYAAARKRLPDPRKTFTALRIGLTVPLIVLTIVAAAIGSWPVPAVLAAGAGLIVAAQLALSAVRPRYLRSAPVRVPVSYERFREEVIGRWVKVYGALPPGAVADGSVVPPAPPRPRVAVLCPDRAVLVCLAANEVGRTRGMALADRLDRLPPGVPVLVLHDASAPGTAFARDARAALRGRAVPVGLAPRAVLGKPNAMRLRDGRPGADELRRLRDLPLSEAETAWLAEGWWSPLAAVPPARLLAALDSATERAHRGTDPDQRAAHAVGFLTWPSR
ncbi:hypothetical protein ACWEQ0_25935 [Nocardia thailandica]